MEVIMQHVHFSILIILFALVTLPCPLLGSDFYVDPIQGSDQNDGTLPGSAWKTVSHALTQIPAKEAIIHMAEGTYSPDSGENFPWEVYAEVDFVGAGPDQTFVDATGAGTAFSAVGSEPVLISGVQIRGATKEAIWAHYNPNFTVTNCYLFANPGSGIQCWHTRAFITYCIAIGNGENGIWLRDYSNGRVTDCITAQQGQNGIIISHESRGLVHRNVALNSESGGIHIISSTTVLQSNLAVSNWVNIRVARYFGEASRPGRILSNTSVAARNTGLSLDSKLDGGIASNIVAFCAEFGVFEGSLFEDSRFSHNLLWDCPVANYVDGSTTFYNTEDDINNLVDNGTQPVEFNLVRDPLFIGGPGGVNTGVVFDLVAYQSILHDASAAWKPGQFARCILFPNTVVRSAYYIIDNSTTSVTVWGDITDASAAAAIAGSPYQIMDYRLQAQSPCIDAGYQDLVQPWFMDLDRHPRTVCKSVDIGCYEFGGTDPLPTYTPYPTQTPLPSHTPNPTYTLAATQTPAPTYTPYPTVIPGLTPLPGDVNLDGIVNADDLFITSENWHDETDY